MSADTLDRATIANILGAVVRSQYPRQALPTIAANHDLTLGELQHLLKQHGYPDKNHMRQWQARLLQQGDVDNGLEHPDSNSVHITQAPKKEPYVTALPVAALFADDAYQRELDEMRVQRMVRDYDPALIGIIEVSARPDGRYAILDGQHRWGTVRDRAFDTADSPHLVCRVHTGLSIDEEAALYHRLNTTRKQLTGWDRWKARRSSGDPIVTDVERIAAAEGFTISYRGAKGHITATKACENVYNLGGGSLLSEVLNVIRSAYRDDPEGVTVGVIQGLGHILTAYTRDELEQERLVEALTGIVPRQLNARAVAVREIHKGTVDKLTAHVIIEQYNAVRRAGQVQPFFARVTPGSPNKGTKRAAEVARAAAVRSWAIEQGLINSERSHVTKAIREAYDLAHADESAA